MIKYNMMDDFDDRKPEQEDNMKIMGEDMTDLVLRTETVKLLKLIAAASEISIDQLLERLAYEGIVELARQGKITLNVNF